MYITQQVGMGVMVAYFTAISVAAMGGFGWFLDTFVTGSFCAANTVNRRWQMCEVEGWESVFLGGIHVS